MTVGAPRMIGQPLFSILLCFRPFEELHPTLILSIPLRLPISFSVYLSFSLLVQCSVGSSLQVLLILFCAHTISVFVSSQWWDSRIFTISSLCRKLSPKRTLKWPEHNHMQITCNTSSAYHMQHVAYHVALWGSSSIKFDRVQITFIIALCYHQWRRGKNPSSRRKPWQRP